jgi:hypothetical protein
MDPASASPIEDEPVTETNEVPDEVLEAVIHLMNSTSPFATVTRGALPTGNGLTCEIGPSTPSTVHMDKNTVVPMDVTINGKHANMKIVSNAMNKIHAVLTRAFSYPIDENGRWEITDIETANLPTIIGREQNNEWLLASALTVKFYWKG